MLVKTLLKKHPNCDLNLALRYQLLYEGGERFLKNVAMFLPRRSSEGNRLYQERLMRAFYVGYVGPIIDYFSSNLFCYNANINHSGEKNPFYDEFFNDVDLKGTEINQFFQEVFTDALIHKEAYILVDFPEKPSDIQIESREEEDALGLSRSYLCHFSKNNLIDWQCDNYGNFEWVKLYTNERFKNSFDGEDVSRHTWYVYDKYTYRIFQFDEDDQKPLNSETADATLVSSGYHSLPGRVPLYKMKVTDGLWVMNKLASVQVEIFNTDNALAWQQYQGNYAMPVIKLEDGKEFKQKMGESYYIKLATGESFEWTEPEGRMMEVGLKRREMMKDEIFRVIHQMSLSIKQTKSQTRQSGSSKQEDRHATEVILREFGDEIRTSMQTLLNWISEARQDKVKWDVSGFSHFDITSLTEKLAQILQLRAINIHSETFNMELEKRVVDNVLEDLNPNVKDKIKGEIESKKELFTEMIEDPLAGAFSKNMVPGGSSFNQKGQSPNNTASAKKTKDTTSEKTKDKTLEKDKNT